MLLITIGILSCIVFANLTFENTTYNNITTKLDCNNGDYKYTYVVNSINTTINNNGTISSNITVISNVTDSQNTYCECYDGWTSLNNTSGEYIWIGNTTLPNNSVIDHYIYTINYCEYKQTPRWTVSLMEGGIGVAGIGGSGWMLLSRGESPLYIVLSVIEFLLSPIGGIIWWFPITLCCCICFGPLALFSLVICLCTLPLYYIMIIISFILMITSTVLDGNGHDMYDGWDLIEAWGE